MSATPEAPARTLRCTVSDPQKQGDGLSAHTTYKVNAEFSSPLPGHAESQKTFTTVHRFSDWVWLRGQLRDAFPYLFVPSIPEKQSLGRFNQEFIELRQRALQRWMDRVTAHPILSGCDLMTKFVTLPADQFASLRDGSSKSTTSAVKDGALAGGAKVFKFVKGKVADVRGGANATKSRSAEDISFAELEAYLLGQAPLLTVIYNAAAKQVGQWRDQAQQLLEYGAALKAMSKAEGGAVGGSYGATGVATWTASTAAYEQSVAEAELWVERLADAVRNGRGVKEMVEERQRASAELAEAVSQVEKLRATITALGSAVTASAAKDKVAAEAEMTAATQAANMAREYYNKVAAAVIAEVERLRVSQKAEWRGLLADWATIQIRNNTKLAQAWERMLPEAQTAVAAEGGVPLPPIALADHTAVAATEGESSSAGVIPPSGMVTAVF